MEPTIPQLLASPTFWFTTVIAGIIVGILGNFATNGIQKIWGRFSETQRMKSEAQEKAFQAEVQDLIDNPSKVVDIKLDAIYSLLSNIAKLMFYLALTNLALGIPINGITFIFNVAFSVFAVSIALSAIKNDDYTRKILKAYYRHKENSIQKPSGATP